MFVERPGYHLSKAFLQKYNSSYKILYFSRKLRLNLGFLFIDTLCMILPIITACIEDDRLIHLIYLPPDSNIITQGRHASACTAFCVCA